MNHDLLRHLSCVKCSSGRFGQVRAVAERVRIAGAATLLCENCGESYPLVAEIARFVPASNYADSFGFQWNTHAATQLDSHCKVTVSRDRVFSVTGWPQDLAGQTILEAGSGAGRFTEVLVTTGANILSFDFSSAVEANRFNNGNSGNLLIFQGDIFNIPVPDRSFDKVLCLGVLQHTPDPKRAFQSLAAKVKPGGSLVIDVYALDLKAVFQWKYLLRPFTKSINHKKLYQFITRTAPRLIPLTRQLRRIAGRVGARLSPIVEYSYLGLDDLTNEEWSILDTFDMYSPAHDHPQTEKTVRRWFSDVGFEDIKVGRGPNGVVGQGVRPIGRSQAPS